MNLTFSTSAHHPAPKAWEFSIRDMLTLPAGEERDVSSSSDISSPSLYLASLSQTVLIGFVSVTWIKHQRTVFISDLGRRDVILTEAVPVVVQQDDDGAVAYSADLDEMGIGETESEALDDLRESIAESYLLLRHEAHLGPLQQRHLRYLKQIIREH